MPTFFVKILKNSCKICKKLIYYWKINYLGIKNFNIIYKSIIRERNVIKMEENKFEEVEEKVEVENGTEGIKISSDVIAVIAGVAVSEVKGVYGMSGGFAGGISEVLKGKKNLAKGIKVDATDEKAKIDVNIIVEYGARIPDVAFEIQNKVKKSVESMTGLKVEEVNVHVQGVNTESLTEEKEEESQQKENEDQETM